LRNPGSMGVAMTEGHYKPLTANAEGALGTVLRCAAFPAAGAAPGPLGFAKSF
jgi:hypothetical protein